MDIEAETSLVRIHGFVGRPESAKKTLGNQFLFVNGRYFRSPYLHKAVMKAYESLIPEGTTPSYFIFLEVDPSTIDVNIHPTKTEIKFEEDSVIFQTLFACVREATARGGAGGDIDFDNPEAREMPVIGPRFSEYRPVSIPTAGVDPDYNPFTVGDRYLDEKDFSMPVGTPSGPSMRPSYTVDKHEDYGKLFEERTMPTAQVLVVQGKYIFSQSASGVMVVSVRRARERILFDRFLKVLSEDVPVTQSTLFPVQVNVGIQGRLLFDAHQDLLKRLGFDIEAFGSDTVVVNGVPEGYVTDAGKVHTMVGDLTLILNDDHGALPEMMAQSLAQKFAVLGASGGEKLSSPTEAQRLLDALLGSTNPEFTSSGRRIISLGVQKIMDACYDAMNDDFNSPIVIANLFEAVRIINSVKDGHSKINPAELALLKKLFDVFVFEILGLVNNEMGSDDNSIVDGLMDTIIDIRKEARAKKDWATSDLIRDKLAALDIVLKDGKDGTTWSKK